VFVCTCVFMNVFVCVLLVGVYGRECAFESSVVFGDIYMFVRVCLCALWCLRVFWCVYLCVFVSA